MQLAQINIARMKGPIDGSLMAEFVANLDRINELAEKADGFVWRLKTDDNNATGIRPFGDDYIVNMSVWRDKKALMAYVYKGGHLEIMKRKREWFYEAFEAYMALWYINLGTYPTIGEGKERLEYLQRNGESPYAFTFKSKFTPDDLNSFLDENLFIL